MDMDWVNLYFIVFSLVLGTAAFLIGAITKDGRARKKLASEAQDLSNPIFLFQQKTLVDATPSASSMINPHLRLMSEYEAAMYVLALHFPDLQRRVEDDPAQKFRIECKSANSIWVDVVRDDDQIRLTIGGAAIAKTVDTSRVVEHDIRMSELDMLRDLTQHTPQLIWQEDLKGKLLWANHAYLTFYDKLNPAADNGKTMWPSEPLMPDLHLAHVTTTPSLHRFSVPIPKERAEQWFDVTSIRRGEYNLHFANDANGIVRADQERRNFIQTLTKTFAQLSIGLAIFDKRQQLATFNPALLDMTHLPIEFLSSRPTIDAVLNRLREARMLPEPKNFTSWRDQFTALEKSAKEGSYSEVWNLHDGQTYRVSGRPHPDGAVAFLFEDISAEVSLTRRFRSDIETNQAILDALPDAIAVFSSAGNLMTSNKAYDKIWGHVQSEGFQQHEIGAAIALWQERCSPTKMWDHLSKFIHTIGKREPWSDNAVLDDGRPINCHAQPIAGGMTMVKFSFLQGVSLAQSQITQRAASM